ncbi:hypothetical protein Trydic_g17168 [Trypoxylus dichotomus]
MTWKHLNSPTPKKFKVQQSAKKIMATVFWDMRGILLIELLPPKTTINSDINCQTLEKLHQVIRQKRKDLGCCMTMQDRTRQIREDMASETQLVSYCPSTI